MDSFVYVLGCLAKNRHLTYVGWTNDIRRRLTQHNAGKGARSTRGRMWVLLYTEKCASRRHAMSREWHLKRDRKFRKQLARQLALALRAP
jgi:putative endonuclease